MNAIEKPANLQTLAVGAQRDQFRLFSATVRLQPGTSSVLGSGVVVAPRWVLTASHLFRMPQRTLHIHSEQMRESVPAVRIHWKSGQTCTLSGSDPWPAEAEGYAGEKDELVLVELERDISAFIQPAALPGITQPDSKDALSMAGYGADDDGNLPGGVQFASMRYAGKCSNRNVAISDSRAQLTNGMARKDDSGAPYFLRRTLPQPLQVIIGIHSGRSTAGRCRLLRLPTETMVACYIPVDGAAQQWIHSLIPELIPARMPVPLGDSAPAAAIMSAGGVSPATLSQPGAFILRGHHACWKLQNAAELDGSHWIMRVAAGTGTVLRTDDHVQIDMVGGQRTLTITRCGASAARWTIALQPGGLSFDSIHWLHGTFTCAPTDPNTAFNNTKFYIFRRFNASVDGTDRRILRIEVFLPGSQHVQPSVSNITTPVNNNQLNALVPTVMSVLTTCALPVPNEPLSIIEDDDQDDEEDGYEG
jgi:hypothetical protein